MVNTGKPSRGCYMCRARRIKCDEGRPGCLRCQKSKRICPGYRDPFELKLRDESRSTKKKHTRKVQQPQQPIFENVVNEEEMFREPFLDPALFQPTVLSRAHVSHSRNSSTSSTSSHDSSRGKAGVDHVIANHSHHLRARGHMITPINQQAACYFLANFVLVPEAGTMRGYFDFIIPLLKCQDPSQSLLLAFSAVSLAALGTRPNSKALLPKADLWYLNALKEINGALRDPAMASSDAILTSVMLMASFEQLTPSRLKIGGWASHIDGAVAVVKSRGSGKQFWQSKISRDLFVSVRAHMTIHCIANSRAVDTSVDWMAIEADDHVIQSFAAVNIKMAALRSDNDQTTKFKLRSPENTERVMALLARAHALDEEYQHWIRALPPGWEIKTVAFVDADIQDLSKSLVHPGRIDAYGELWMAYKFNIVRSCRLFIWSTILRCVAWLGESRDYRLTPEYTTASRICRQLIEDIVASVPYFFGWNKENEGAMNARANFACGSNDSPTAKPLTGIFVMWPLFTAAASDFVSPSQRIFLRGRLKHVAEIMGINQALILFEAQQFAHPSVYIARERANLKPARCLLAEATELQVDEEEPENPHARPAPPAPLPPQPQQQNWLPRTFGFGETGFFQNAVTMKQNFTRYLEGYELAGF